MNEELQAVQASINDLHRLMVTLSDPEDVNNVSGCLRVLTGIQKKMASTQQSNPAIAALGGGARPPIQ